MALPQLGFIVEASTDAARRGLAGLGDAIDSLRQRSQGFGQGLSDAFQEISQVNQDDAFGFMAMEEAAGQLQNMGSQIQGLVGGYLDEAGKLAGEFDGIFAQIAQKSGAADEELQAMRDKALALGGSTAHSASGVAAVMKDLAADGFSTAEILEGTDKVLSLATAGEMKAEEAGLYLSDIFAGFKPNLDPMMSTGEAFQHLSDQMAAASDSTSLNVDQVARTFLKFGPVAADAGVSFSEASALVGAVSPVAKAEEAGTALKSIVTSARVAASKEVEKMWAEMGYSFENFVDENGQADFLGILDFFRQAQLSADQVVAIFGKEFLPVANTLLSEEGFGSATELLESQMAAAGKTGEIAGVMEEAAGAAGGLEGAIETLKIKLGSVGVWDFMNGFDTLKTKVIQFIADLPAPVLGAATAVMGLVAGFGALLAATGAGIAGASTIGLLLPKITLGLDILKSRAIGPLIGTVKTFFFTTLPGALATLPATIAGFLPVILPVLGVILALGVAALLIYKYWKPIKAFFDGFAEGFMLAMTAMKAEIVGAFQAAIEPLKELRPALTQIKKTLADLGFSIFKEQLDTSGNAAKSWGQTIGKAVGSVVKFSASGLIALIQAIGVFIQFGVALGEGLYTIYEKISKFFGGLIDGFVAFGVALGEGLYTVYERIRLFFGGMGSVFEMAKADFDTIVAVVQSWITLVSSGFNLAGQRIKTALGDVWASISSFGTYVIEGFQLVFAMLGAWLSDLYSLYVAPYVDAIVQGILDYMEGFRQFGVAISSQVTLMRSEAMLQITRVKLVIESFLNYLGLVFEGIKGRVIELMVSLADKAKTVFDFVIASIETYVLTPVRIAFSAIQSKITGAITQALSLLGQVGMTISTKISGVITQASLFLGQVGTTISTKISGAITQASLFLGQIGTTIMAGFLTITGVVGSFFGLIGEAISAYIILPVMAALVGLWEIVSGALGAIGGWIFDHFDQLMGPVGGVFGGLLNGFGGLWDIVSEVFSPAVAMFRAFVEMVSAKFNQLRQAAAALNPFGGGGAAVNTKENRNNAENQAAAAGVSGATAATATSISTATAASSTATGAVTTNNSNNSKSVQVGSITVNSNATDPKEVVNQTMNEINWNVAKAM